MTRLGLVADPVIEAIARLEFEDGLRTGVLPGSPPWRLLGPLERPHLWCGCHGDPPVRPNSNSAEFRSSVVLNHSCYVVLGLNRPRR